MTQIELRKTLANQLNFGNIDSEQLGTRCISCNNELTQEEQVSCYHLKYYSSKFDVYKIGSIHE